MKGIRAVASLSLLVGQDRNISSIFPNFPVVSLIFPQIFFIFFLILVFRVGGSPTRDGPGYATEGNESDVWNINFELQVKRGDKFACFTFVFELYRIIHISVARCLIEMGLDQNVVF